MVKKSVQNLKLGLCLDLKLGLGPDLKLGSRYRTNTRYNKRYRQYKIGGTSLDGTSLEGTSLEGLTDKKLEKILEEYQEELDGTSLEDLTYTDL